MERADVAAPAIEVFSDFYRQLEGGATGLVREADVDPLVDVDRAADVGFDARAQRDAAAVTAVIKLNGGLGTSMGMDRAKTLLPVRADLTFLDVIARQVQQVRRDHDVSLPLLFMHSFRTRDDSLAALAAHEGLEVDGLPLDFLQNREPKLPARRPENLPRFHSDRANAGGQGQPPRPDAAHQSQRNRGQSPQSWRCGYLRIHRVPRCHRRSLRACARTR